MLFDFCLELRISLSFRSTWCYATDRWHYVIVWWELDQLEANNIQPTGLTIDNKTIGNCFNKWWLCRTYPKWNSLIKLNHIRSKNGQLLYQVPCEGSPDMDCRCGWLTFQKLERRSLLILDSEDYLRPGCRNVSQQQEQQESFSGLPSPARSHLNKVCDKTLTNVLNHSERELIHRFLMIYVQKIILQ